MEELKISEMLQCQYKLWEKNKNIWAPLEPNNGRNSLLWMIEELGEVISIIKKRGEEEIMNNPELREKFQEELVDVFMYYLDALNCYKISGQDFSNAYLKKYNYNIKRNYEKEHKEFLN